MTPYSLHTRSSAPATSGCILLLMDRIWWDQPAIVACLVKRLTLDGWSGTETLGSLEIHLSRRNQIPNCPCPELRPEIEIPLVTRPQFVSSDDESHPMRYSGLRMGIP